MQLVDQIQVGPFTRLYHRDLADVSFKEQLESFLQRNLLSQLDSPIREFSGTLTATYAGNEKKCGPNSSLRNIFTLECVAFCDDGTSELKADIVYDPERRTFRPRTGRDRYFFVWTPLRKKTREAELSAIQRVVDDILRGERRKFTCPICGGKITATNTPNKFDATCMRRRCFVYSFDKDERGRLTHGRFFTKHPEKRAEESDEPESE